MNIQIEWKSLKTHWVNKYIATKRQNYYIFLMPVINQCASVKKYAILWDFSLLRLDVAENAL